MGKTQKGIPLNYIKIKLGWPFYWGKKKKFDLELQKTIWWPLDGVFFSFLLLEDHLVVIKWFWRWIARDHLVVSTLNYKGPLGAH
jgi:hypothetical protein